MGNSPSFEDKIYKKRLAQWSKVNAFRDGIGSVVKLLNKWERESVDGYKARQNVATLFNATKKTILTANGLLFRKEIAWTDDLNAQFLEKALSNIDNCDSDLNEFAKDVTASALWYGISFILVDLPKSDIVPETRQQQIDLGLVPYFTKVEVPQIVNRRIEGNKLVQITIRETVTEPDGEFGEKDIEQYRVLNIGSGRIFRDNVVVHEWVTGLDYIPLIPIYSNKEGYLDASPKFMDLIDLNLKHFNFQSQLDKTLFIASNPVPKIWGSLKGDEDSMTIGVDQALVFARKDEGDFEWTEFKGTSVDKLQDEINNTEKRMAVIGLSMLTQREGLKTATEKVIESTSENSDLVSVASSIEAGLNTAYIYWCDIMKTPITGEISANKDFNGVAMTPDQAKTYLEMYNSGTLTLDQLWDELQKQEFIGKFDREVAKANLEAKNQNVALG
jgi:hypothetical protein